MIILLSYTFESQTAHEVTETLNTQQQMRLCESVYCGREFRDHLVETILTHPDQYSANLQQLVRNGKFNTIIEQVTHDQQLFDEVLKAFDQSYDKLFQALDKFPKDQKIIVACPHKSAKPSNVDLFVGWAVRPEDYGIEHLSEHEQVTDSQVAVNISELHNKWMRDHISNYDLFFDQLSVEQVIGRLRNI